jgi:SAM-dependent methyltransferase
MLASLTGGHRVQGSALALPLAAGCFDAVFAVTSLLLAPRELVTAFLEIRRVLVPGGTLALTLLERDVGGGLEGDLAASGLRPGHRFSCGQDVGWIVTRTAS